MTIFDQINKLEILNVLDIAGISYKKDSGQPHTYTLVKLDWKLDNSFKVSSSKNIAKDFWWDGIEWGVFDFIGRYLLNQDTQSNIGKATTVKWFIEKWLVEDPTINKPEFIKSLKDDELLERYNEFKLNGYKNEVSAFLMMRWVPYDWIQNNHLKIWEVFKDIWYYDNYFCTEFESYKDENWDWVNQDWDKPKTVSVFMFPCYDEYKELIGVKLRRKDGKTIRGKKSLAIGKTWLLYNKINENKAIIVEWETDWIILTILWYDNVVGNLWWVQSNKIRLKNLLYETWKVICLYDNDVAGQTSKKDLAGMFGRIIHEVVYPIREDSKWRILSDVNDFYNAWYNTKAKWDKILDETKIVWEEQDQKQNTPFIILRKFLTYYDTEYKKFQSKTDVADFLWVKNADLVRLRKDGAIHTYEDLCYMEWWKPWHYNTLDETTIIKNGWDAQWKIHPHIAHLIHNICANKNKNIEWVHRSILYKLTHINDVHIPALVLYGSWWSGKWTFLNLLSKIFWEENTLIWLGQKDLESSFDSFQGNKLIVEFKEVSSWNKHNDKKILDRIKSMVWESKITVRWLYQDAKEVDNIWRFHLSSNHAVPIQMDSKHSGNRRFTIIKTWNSLDSKMAEDMNHKTFNDRKVIREYVNWLYETYPDVPDLTIFPSLDNEEKRNLEDVCEWASNQFFEWFEEKFPHIHKVTNKEKNILLDMYCNQTGEDKFDIKFKQNNFDLWLSHRYEKKKLSIRWTSERWYFIKKTKFELDNMPEGKKNYFDKGELEKMEWILF